MFGRALLGTSLALLLFVGCTPESGGSDRPSPESSVSSQPADSHLRFGVLGDVATLDPYSPKASDLTFALVRPVYPSLYRFNPDGSTESYLAAGIDVSARKAVVTLADMSWSHAGQIDSKDVVASWRRATERSGFSTIARARATGPNEVTFQGDVEDWPSTLATNAFVLPKGKVGRSYAGPYMIEQRIPGLVVRYGVNPSWSGPEQGFTRLSVFSTDTTGAMLSLLENEKLDAAWFPSMVNLADRLDAADLRYDSALGWSSVHMRAGSGLAPGVLRAVGGSINRLALQEAFVRDDGRVSDTLHPGPGDGGADGPFRSSGGGAHLSLVLAAPHGDELLEFLQDAIQLQLAKIGFDVETIDLPVKEIYSEPYEEGVALLRAEGAPNAPDPRSAYRTAIPLFNVRSYVVWNQNVHPLEVNPTVEGPLWDVERWTGN